MFVTRALLQMIHAVMNVFIHVLPQRLFLWGSCFKLMKRLRAGETL
jgi:hypothetical protein